jgi:hypothetical protein
MARLISISLVAAVISNLFVFAQKNESVPMRMLVQESVLTSVPFVYDGLGETAEAEKTSSVTMHVDNTANSNYLMVEVQGAPQAMPFQLMNSQGKEVYSGSIRGTQLVDTESWPAGTYYFLCGTKRETIYITK